MDERHPVFPGFGPYLEAAARECGLEDAVPPARANRVLSNLGNLCSQAPAGDPAGSRAVLVAVEGLAAQLRLAALAGERMVAELRSRLDGAGAAGATATEATGPAGPEARPRRGARPERRAAGD
jgi:hypothetical protein